MMGSPASAPTNGHCFWQLIPLEFLLAIKASPMLTNIREIFPMCALHFNEAFSYPEASRQEGHYLKDALEIVLI